MRSHIISGKESQCSLINYKKDGTPFINLVTMYVLTPIPFFKTFLFFVLRASETRAKIHSDNFFY